MPWPGAVTSPLVRAADHASQSPSTPSSARPVLALALGSRRAGSPAAAAEAAGNAGPFRGPTVAST
eukprot:3998503-Alexandrium_andersonii.AAC.1